MGGLVKLGNHARVGKKKENEGEREGGRAGCVEWGGGEERLFPKGKNGRVTIATIYSQLPFKKFT